VEYAVKERAMILSWRQFSDKHSALAQTAFVKAIIEVDWLSTRKAADELRYVAAIETINGAVLRSQDNMESMATARLYCEQSYIDLLEKELERCYAAMRVTP